MLIPCRNCITFSMCKERFNKAISKDRFYTAGLDELLNNCHLFEQFYIKSNYEHIIDSCDELLLDERNKNCYKSTVLKMIIRRPDGTYL